MPTPNPQNWLFAWQRGVKVTDTNKVADKIKVGNQLIVRRED